MEAQLKHDVQKSCEGGVRTARVLQDYGEHLKNVSYEFLSEYIDDLITGLYISNPVARIIIQHYEDRRLVVNHGASKK